MAASPRLTYIGGPTLLIEWQGFRLVTDPTFDPAGTEYRTPVYTLRKTQPPAIPMAELGRIDAILLSHDHHFDNLDHAGRLLLATAPRTVTTTAGAERLGGTAVGLAAGESLILEGEGGRRLDVRATPARHGPAHGDRGPVIGFMLAIPDHPGPAIYLSGDTVWYDDLASLGGGHGIGLAVLFAGAARVAAVGPDHLTLSAVDAVRLTRALSPDRVVPVHFEGWGHFSEGRRELASAFEAAGLAGRLVWLAPGVPCDIQWPDA